MNRASFDRVSWSSTTIPKHVFLSTPISFFLSWFNNKEYHGIEPYENRLKWTKKKHASNGLQQNHKWNSNYWVVSFYQEYLIHLCSIYISNQFTEAKVLCKKGFSWKFSLISQNNTCVGVSFSCEICEFIKNTYFEEHLRRAPLRRECPTWHG